MILIDTDVIAELWRMEPDPQVLAWLDDQALETLYLSAITVAELRYGIAAMPEGKRRTVFQTRLNKEVLPAFAERVLAFDLAASKPYAELMARAKADGKAIGQADGTIAAIATAHGLIIATRDRTPSRPPGSRSSIPGRCRTDRAERYNAVLDSRRCRDELEPGEQSG